LHGKGQFSGTVETPASAAVASAPAAAPSGDEITDDEFEALLDQLHGKGQFSGAAEAAAPVAAVAAAPAPASDDITDDEFES
ncbi:hypothetical protein ACXWO0_10655, partial [Streptococcus pyogenes]